MLNEIEKKNGKTSIEYLIDGNLVRHIACVQYNGETVFMLMRKPYNS